MWSYTINTLQLGPVSETDLKALFDRGEITAQTLVKREGEYLWNPLELTALAEAFGLRPPDSATRQVCAYSGLRTLQSDMSDVEGFWIANDYKADALEYMRNGGWLPTEISGLRPTGYFAWGYLAGLAASLLKTVLIPACLIHFTVNVPLWFYAQTYAPRTEETSAFGDYFSIVGFFTCFLTVQALSISGIIYLLSRHARQQRPGAIDALRFAFSTWGAVASYFVGFMLLIFSLKSLFFFLIQPVQNEALGAILHILAVLIPIVALFYVASTLLAPLIVIERSVGLASAMRLSRSISRPYLKEMIVVVSATALVVQICLCIITVPLTAYLNGVYPGLIDSIPTPITAPLLTLGIVPVLAMLFCYYKAIEVLYLNSQR